MNSAGHGLRIYVNGRFLAQPVTGVQRYAREVLRSIDNRLASQSSMQWTVVAPHGTPNTEVWQSIHFATTGKFSGHTWEQLELPRHTRDGWLLSFSGAPSVLHRRSCCTIFDTAIYDAPAGYSLAYRTFYRVVYALALPRARAVFTTSEFSRSRIAQWFPAVTDRIVVTLGGADHLRPDTGSAAGVEPSDNDLALKSPYVLAVSSLAPNKNFRIILEVAALMRGSPIRFVIAGRSNPRIFGYADLSSANLQWVGPVNDAALRQLYRNAACFVFPSLFEGFGLPPLEAMSFGCPVIASNVASIPEVCGDAALYFDPRAPEELKAHIMRVLSDPGLAADLRARGTQQVDRYHWGHVAETILTTLDSLARKHSL